MLQTRHFACRSCSDEAEVSESILGEQSLNSFRELFYRVVQEAQVRDEYHNEQIMAFVGLVVMICIKGSPGLKGESRDGVGESRRREMRLGFSTELNFAKRTC